MGLGRWVGGEWFGHGSQWRARSWLRSCVYQDSGLLQRQNVRPVGDHCLAHASDCVLTGVA